MLNRSHCTAWHRTDSEIYLNGIKFRVSRTQPDNVYFSNVSGMNNVLIGENIVFLTNGPRENGHNDGTIPFYLSGAMQYSAIGSAYSELALSWRHESLTSTRSSILSSAYLNVRERAGALVIQNGFLLDENLFANITILTAPRTIATIDLGTRVGQRMTVHNSTAHAVTLPQLNLTAPKILNERQSAVLQFTGTAWVYMTF